MKYRITSNSQKVGDEHPLPLTFVYQIYILIYEIKWSKSSDYFIQFFTKNVISQIQNLLPEIPQSNVRMILRKMHISYLPISGYSVLGIVQIGDRIDTWTVDLEHQNNKWIVVAFTCSTT